MTQTTNHIPYDNAPANHMPGVHPSAPVGPAGSDDDEDDSFNIRDFLLLCLTKWRWFVVSILIFIGLGVFYILSTPKTYTREASVLIKDQESGGSSAVTSSLSELGLFQSSTNVNNELLAFQSPALIADVVSRLGLQTNYTIRKGLKNVTLYGDSLPIEVSFIGLTPDNSAFLEARILGEGKVELSKMILDNVECDEELTVVLGDTVRTPIGTIAVNAGPAYRASFSKPIKVSHLNMPSAILTYRSKLSESISDDKADVIDFVFKDVSIQRADNFLTTLINIYNEKWVNDQNEMAIANSRFIAERLKVIEQELGNVDSSIADYKGEHLVPDVEAASTMYMENANEFTKRQLEVSTQLAVSRYVLDYIKDPANEGHLLPTNSGINNPGIEAQIQEFNTKQLERNDLANTTGQANPLLQDIDKSLSSMRSALTTSLANQQRAFQAQLNSLISGDKATNRKIASSPAQAKYLLSVERQQKVKEALYTFLLQKREENELSRAFTPYNTRIITPPMSTGTPPSPNSRNILMICFAVGMLIPALILFLSESLDSRLRNRADLDGVKTPLLGEIPEASDSNINGRLRRIRRRWIEILGKDSRIEQVPSLLVHEHGRSIVNEAFRMIRSNLEFMTRGGRNRVIMVTSFNPGSGKSFISLNLAATLALKNKGRKVLIIDLDLRRASVSRILPNHARGIADYLSEVTDDCDKLVQPTSCPGLFILPVGTIPPNPSELLYSDRLKNLIERYKEEYDYIFIDCPPAEIVADASIITPLADMTIFVIRAGLLDRRMIPEIDRIYDSHRYKNFMLILNGTSAISAPYRRYAYKAYCSEKKDK